MPRYYLNLRRGPGRDKLTPDPEGDELADERLVHPHVLGVIREVIKTPCHAVREWMVCSFEITDEAQHLVTTVPFSAIVVEPVEDE